MSIGVVWFGNDLRTSDQAMLWQASHEVEQLICIYCNTPLPGHTPLNNFAAPSHKRQRFLQDGLDDLASSLAEMGHSLFVSEQQALQIFPILFNELPITHVYRNHHPGWYEQKSLNQLIFDFPDIQFQLHHGLTLFEPKDLPFTPKELPDSFSKFRKAVELSELLPPAPEVQFLPPQVSFVLPGLTPWVVRQREEQLLFNGGELAALTQLSDYFATELASHYKETRNALDGWEHSTKFSPWLAQGSISPSQIKACLDVYERDHCANDSTYWIFFELLWREYFHWYGTRYGKDLFRGQGIRGQGSKGSFYAERFQKWCQGNTPYPIVNACMKQLNSTGYMSNRGRQLVASCLIYDLGIDWRYGAAYFESQLVDFDVASNWGNWQYIAGVGADPRGGRHFNLNKQTQMYDPEHHFIERWGGHQCDQQLDSVDAADWPIAPKQ
ncbi:Cryptochrome DASH [Marinomonas gallaica]|uniref:Cryptochrome DASH n=1 Tax=Marinomonas gallaica TaxID=1806667 RepID=A0A1C3JLM5_9GAMM|nr:DASH family cryptochrome [Marinomonas gallaica]SBT16029.1 Cryptochrome DASH [Marinomonas gallaica]SBT21077.1 Cryptochrome DASH [Marinomonas gallaica]